MALHLVLCLLLDFHEIARMSSLQNVRSGLVTTMLKGLNEYLLVLYFPHSLPVWVNIGMGDLCLLLLSSCHFFADWFSATHTLLKDMYEMLPAFF